MAGKERAGISYLLANADVSAGIIEHCLSSDTVLNNRCFFTHSTGLTYVSLPVHPAFHELREKEDNIISRKIKNAYPIEASGYARASAGKYGEYFKSMFKDNIMFIGDASGGAGNIHGMIQGHFAGVVAAAAIKENDIGEGRLSEYQELVIKTLGKAPFFWFSAREDFGSFDEWFRKFRESTEGLRAAELVDSW